MADILADEYLEGELAADAGAEATDADAVTESGSEASAEAAGPGTTTADDATSADVDADAAESADDLAGGEDLADDSGAGAGAAEDAPADTPEQSASGNTSGGSSAGSNCFKAGTLVTTPHGEVPIEKIKVGDLVESRDPATGKTAFEPVLKLYVHYHKAVDDVTLISAGASAETIAATPQHPFHVSGIGWVGAGALKVGEHVDDLRGSPVTVQAVVPEANTQTVYNLDVASFHTYFVGKDQAWVHNSCGQGPTEPYNRSSHYGKTPTAADRTAIGAGQGQVADHQPPLVQRYYEGDPATGEKPGYQMTSAERAASAADRTRMSVQPQAASNSQGGFMSAYSRIMRGLFGF